MLTIALRCNRNQAILHSMAREWSAAGLEERQACFQPLLDELTKRIPLTFADRYTKRILIPGCGAGRLPVEISALGYCAEGNEFSVFMLLASNFVMNGCDQVGQYELFPWIERYIDKQKLLFINCNIFLLTLLLCCLDCLHLQGV